MIKLKQLISERGLGDLSRTSYPSLNSTQFRKKDDEHELRDKISEDIKQGFEQRAEQFRQAVEKAKIASMKKEFPNLPPPKYTIDKGKKYWRIVANDTRSGHRAVYCFLDTATGDIFKAASWKAPAKHARGNIFSPDMLKGVGQYGADYIHGNNPDWGFKKEASKEQWAKRMARTNDWKRANPALANAKRSAKEKQMPWLRKQKPLTVKEGGPGSGPRRKGTRPRRAGPEAVKHWPLGGYGNYNKAEKQQDDEMFPVDPKQLGREKFSTKKESASSEQTKVAKIRDPNAIQGRPAQMYYNCPCGSGPAVTGSNVTCKCGKTYDPNGWVVKKSEVGKAPMKERTESASTETTAHKLVQKYQKLGKNANKACLKYAEDMVLDADEQNNLEDENYWSEVYDHLLDIFEKMKSNASNKPVKEESPDTGWGHWATDADDKTHAAGY